MEGFIELKQLKSCLDCHSTRIADCRDCWLLLFLLLRIFRSKILKKMCQGMFLVIITNQWLQSRIWHRTGKLTKHIQVVIPTAITNLNIYGIRHYFKLNIIGSLLSFPEVNTLLCCEMIFYEIHVNVPAKYLVTVYFSKKRNIHTNWRYVDDILNRKFHKGYVDMVPKHGAWVRSSVAGHYCEHAFLVKYPSKSGTEPVPEYKFETIRICHLYCIYQLIVFFLL